MAKPVQFVANMGKVLRCVDGSISFSGRSRSEVSKSDYKDKYFDFSHEECQVLLVPMDAKGTDPLETQEENPPSPPKHLRGQSPSQRQRAVYHHLFAYCKRYPDQDFEEFYEEEMERERQRLLTRLREAEQLSHQY